MLTKENKFQLQEFFNKSQFAESGAVITDLDGTAIHEFQGKYTIPESVELGLKKIYDLGRPVVLNTLRFPISVIKTFGKDWYKISGTPIPAVLMNGSTLGYVKEDQNGLLIYEEIESFPLLAAEIDSVINIVNDFISKGVTDLLVFYYPRNWTKGEIIWTPVPEKIQDIHAKYTSASAVYSSGIINLQENLSKEDINMIFLLIDLPQDKLMAYQHTKQSNFFTTTGTDKLSGAEKISTHLNFKLEHSLGAGDTQMDTFLKGVGQPVHVGNPFLTYDGILPAIKIDTSSDLGELLSELATMQKTIIPMQ